MYNTTIDIVLQGVYITDMAIRQLRQRGETHLSKIVKEAIQNDWSVKYIRDNYVNPTTGKPYSRYAIYHHYWRINADKGVSKNG